MRFGALRIEGWVSQFPENVNHGSAARVVRHGDYDPVTEPVLGAVVWYCDEYGLGCLGHLDDCRV